MEKESYETKLFCMNANPETKRKTMLLEVELSDEDFNEVKERWVDSERLDIMILKK